ncbi:aspartate aminotransferase family protein [Desulforhopalus singaporensis]|uniref:Taurine--pyruvate aminotransferase n=1 Tax=Desulforhopalus singaporensis TaxID=91360 RepID=A0A1H0PU27_9BACT|nr:aminotransferase class III-fold pyridoxal phosphate-dependent enzyme [Desulforhopalus singaporensis]SDP08613.1 putrescine aminotransferase [Desulforhopalus singaporensis]
MQGKWISVDEVAGIPYKECVNYFKTLINPGLVALLEMGEYTGVQPQSAAGSTIIDTSGRRILDFVSSYGALNLGHNHPEVKKAMLMVLEEERVDLSKELLSPYAACLAHNLKLLTPGNLNRFYFCNSGTEAVEAALKLAARYFKGRRSRFIYAENSLHGKTLGALSVTGGQRLRQHFPLLPGKRVPYGDAGAIERILRHNPDKGEDAVAAVILEPIQGEAGVIVPPDGYLQKVKKLCERFGVLLILDEVQTGMCRTGSFFACQHDEVIPDLLVIAKSLGGGLASIGATIATTRVFDGAYSNPHDCLVQTSTFGGRSTSCAAAIAALEVCCREKLDVRAQTLGSRLINGLRQIQMKYPEWIREIRGRGLMVGIEFNEDIIDRTQYLPARIPGLKNVLKEHLPGMVAAALLKHHSILGTLMLNNRSVLRVYPPLIVTEEEVDRFLAALEDVLSRGAKMLVKDRVNHAIGSFGLKFITPWVASLGRDKR